jgi:hypothetical protein
MQDGDRRTAKNTKIVFDAERAAQIVATPKSSFAGYVYLAVRPLSFA